MLEGVAPRVALLPVFALMTRSMRTRRKRADRLLDAAATAQGIEWAATQGVQIIVVLSPSPRSDALASTSRGVWRPLKPYRVGGQRGCDHSAVRGGHEPRYPAAHLDALAVTSATGGVPDGGQVSRTSILRLLNLRR